MLKKARLLTHPTPARQDAPFRGQGRSEGLPTPYTSLKGSGRGCPLLRASSDHCFIVGALRARSTWPLPAPFFSILLEDSAITVPHLSRHIVELRQMQDSLGHFLS